MFVSADTSTHERPRRFAWIGLAPCALIGFLWIWSGWYGIGARYGDFGLAILGDGELLVQIVQVSCVETLDDFLEAAWDPDPVPPAGLTRGDTFHLSWPLPGLHRVSRSSLGTWWFVHVPLWFVFLVALAGPVWRRRTRILQRHSPVAPVAAFGPSAASARSAAFASSADSPEENRRKRGAWRRRGLIAGGAVALLWAASGAYYASFHYGGLIYVELSEGVLIIEYDIGGGRLEDGDRLEDGEDFGWDVLRSPAYSLAWTLPHTAECSQSVLGWWREIDIPQWFLFLLVVTPVAWSLRRRRHPRGFCHSCGYNLTGNVSGRCPECGRGIEIDSIDQSTEGD
jgi:hypothetical protein